MCCFKARKKPACIVTLFSTLAIIGGIVMGYFAIRFNGSDLVQTFKGVGSTSNTAFLVLIIASGVALVTGILGTLLCCIKHRCYTVLFGSLLTIVWLVALIVGLFLVMLNGTSVKTL